MKLQAKSSLAVRPEQPAPSTPAAEPLRLPVGVLQYYGLQRKPAENEHETAANGLRGTAGSLPHLSQIQHSFGRHDVSHVQAHTDGTAARASRALGAEAYATGDHVAFGRTPSLHTAAHEAAHVVQQRAGVHLKGGVGEAHDQYEQHADAVADLVVQGRSAEPLLDGAAGNGAGSPAIQRKISIQEGPKEWNTAGDALQELQPLHPTIVPEVLTRLLTMLDRDNRVFATRQELDSLLREVEEHLGIDVNPEEWMVLHRLKDQTFEKFFDQRGKDGKQARKEHIDTDSRYDPAKFGTGRHTWDGNEEWMSKAIKEFTRAVLTDVPLSKKNCVRTSPNKRGQFSAYAREIASLLLNKYLPFVKEPGSAVYMVDYERLPDSLVPLVTEGKTINTKLANCVLSGDAEDVGWTNAATCFRQAGLPTSQDEEQQPFAIGERKPENGKDEEEKKEDKGSQQQLVLAARELLCVKLVLPQKTWNKGGSLKTLWTQVKEMDLIPKDMSQNKFKDDMLIPLLPTIYQPYPELQKQIDQ